MYFPILNQLQIELQKNEELSNALKLSLKKSSNNSNKEFDPASTVTQSSFLKSLVNTDKNTGKKKGARYDNTLKLFASYLYIIGGKMLYETLCTNLPLPSLSTVSRTLDDSSAIIIEGISKFLTVKKFTYSSMFSEDATNNRSGTI